MTSQDVRLWRDGKAGRITLNRPRNLHALTGDMCEQITSALIDWHIDPEVALVIIDHEPGTRGFCAGGDVRQVAASGRGDGVLARAFMRAEYRMNCMLDAFPKPCVAILDGITMGGGAGVSVHGSIRVATEKTIFAMPETAIGLFPDVGGGWFLPRLRGQTGTWLGLTATRLTGADMHACGLATHFVPSSELTVLISQLCEGRLGCLEAWVSAGAVSWCDHQRELDNCFSGNSVAAIRDRLMAAESGWIRAQAGLLEGKSPLSLKVTLAQLRVGAALRNLAEVLVMEYRISSRMTRSHDFIEGIRAMLEDRDRLPAFRPARLEEVTPAMVRGYFEPLGRDELDLADLPVPQPRTGQPDGSIDELRGHPG